MGLLSSLIVLFSNIAEAWYYRGIALDELGRHAEAVDSYDRAIAINPDYTKVKQNREIAIKN